MKEYQNTGRIPVASMLSSQDADDTGKLARGEFARRSFFGTTLSQITHHRQGLTYVKLLRPSASPGVFGGTRQSPPRAKVKKSHHFGPTCAKIASLSGHFHPLPALPDKDARYVPGCGLDVAYFQFLCCARSQSEEHL